MSDPCYLCDNPVPDGQSFYEDHGVKVCLSCFRDTPRCKKCKFPSNQLEIYPGMGALCEFCQKKLNDTGMECYLCKKNIPSWMSHYADYDKTVCQECFAEADRCFLCRFPHSVEKVPSLGHLCEFCQESVISSQSDTTALLTPLYRFLEQHGHPIKKEPVIQWMDWNLILGMQTQDAPPQKIKFLDEFLRYGYPVFYLKGKIYLIHRISQQHFLPHMAGQMAAAQICEQYQRPHLQGNTPFDQLARGWCHWIAFSTAKVLKYPKIQKELKRWPEQHEEHAQKFYAMAEFRKPKELVAYARTSLKDYASRYL